MPGTEPFDYLSLWGIFAATMALALLAVVAGYFLGSRLRTEEAKKAPVGELVGAMLTLASLLLAFTFGWAQSHFDTRRDLLLDEANAIGTTWLRARLVPDPHRSEVRKLLHEYLEVRLQAAQSGKLQQLPELQQAIGRSEHLHDRLWAEAGRIGEIDPLQQRRVSWCVEGVLDTALVPRSILRHEHHPAFEFDDQVRVGGLDPRLEWCAADCVAPNLQFGVAHRFRPIPPKELRSHHGDDSRGAGSVESRSCGIGD